MPTSKTPQTGTIAGGTPKSSDSKKKETRKVQFQGFSPSPEKGSGFDQIDNDSFSNPFACSTPGVDQKNEEEISSEEEQSTISLSESAREGKRKRRRKRKNSRLPKIVESNNNNGQFNDSEFKVPSDGPPAKRRQIALVQKYSSEKKRPDTPRVLKHPNFHQIFPFPPENNPNSSFEEFSGTKSASLVQHTNKNNAEKPEDVVKSIKSYDSFSPITDISDILVGDKVAFKVSFFEFT